ncbi:serine/threonine-protein kinase [Mycobacterium sp. ITM-2016-00316]|uniref:serine/threonine-protein kinase n=1 Tax=Mycobacterium sp. ITM-2016-00316 TaxID=2099695 RepID=UPI000CF86275|nr:serine/threonine-protein kinase [Mycobacterium sp. ITM-2016-00316]WNG81621.1 serine/threonine-protein kinase [Mycobacterium sp. ITM-2016-00316]
MLEPGDVISDYTIDALLGSGASADVYRVHHTGSTDAVALKVLHTDPAGHPRTRERFAREFTIAAMLDHPHIVAMYEQGDSPALWMTMQYIDGPESSVLIPKTGQEPDIAAILRASGQIADAVDYAHSMDVLHRDIKPANILLDIGHENAFLNDFGIAQLIDDVSPLARNGRVRGSIAYAAPELLQGQQLTPATDLYGLACTMVEWITALPPYPRSTPFAITYAHLHDPTPALSRRRRWLPSGIDSIFAKALAKDPAARYVSCTELVDIVSRLLRGVPVPPARSAGHRWPWDRN